MLVGQLKGELIHLPKHAIGHFVSDVKHPDADF